MPFAEGTRGVFASPDDVRKKKPKPPPTPAYGYRTAPGWRPSTDGDVLPVTAAKVIGALAHEAVQKTAAGVAAVSPAHFGTRQMTAPETPITRAEAKHAAAKIAEVAIGPQITSLAPGGRPAHFTKFAGPLEVLGILPFGKAAQGVRLAKGLTEGAKALEEAAPTLAPALRATRGELKAAK